MMLAGSRRSSRPRPAPADTRKDPGDRVIGIRLWASLLHARGARGGGGQPGCLRELIQVGERAGEGRDICDRSQGPMTIQTSSPASCAGDTGQDGYGRACMASDINPQARSTHRNPKGAYVAGTISPRGRRGRGGGCVAGRLVAREAGLARRLPAARQCRPERARKSPLHVHIFGGRGLGPMLAR